MGFLYSSEADPDGEFDNVEDADAEHDFAVYLREIELARQAVAGRNLDETFFHTHRNARMSVRWPRRESSRPVARLPPSVPSNSTRWTWALVMSCRFGRFSAGCR